MALLKFSAPALTVDEILMAPGALPVKLTLVAAEFGTVAGDQLVAVFQLVFVAPVQVWPWARVPTANARVIAARMGTKREWLKRVMVRLPGP